MKKLLAVTSMLVLWIAVSACFAQNDYEPDSQVVDGHRWAVVKRMDIFLFGIPVGGGGYSKDERARIVANERLDVLLGHGVLDKPENIEVGRMNGEVVIQVRNENNVGGLGNPTLVLTIDSNFENYLHASRWDIAYYWRDLMRKWSHAGVMKSVAKDPAGRDLDKENSWHLIPSGYSDDLR